MDPVNLPARAMIGATFTLALILTVLPLPLEWRWWRPEFVLLLVIYWTFTMPQRTSLLMLLGLGLFQDVLVGAPLGQHALILLIVAYICIQSYQRVRNYTRWQQCLWVFVLVGVGQLIDNWVQSMAGRPLSGLQFLYPAMTTAALWPLLFPVMEKLRRYYRIERWA